MPLGPTTDANPSAYSAVEFASFPRYIYKSSESTLFRVTRCSLRASHYNSPN